jgi:acetyltransferase-like isoleucine patch superfamily enzyme
MSTLLFGLIFVSPPFLKIWLLRLCAGATVERGARLSWFSSVRARRVTLGAHSVIRPFTLIRLDGELTLGPYSEVSSFTLVYGSSSFHVGEGSYIGPQSLLNVDQEVQIGDGSALGPRSMVFTHGSFLPVTEGYWAKLAGVRVGSHVWCAAGVFLHPGTEIGDDTFVNSRSVVSGTIPAGSVVDGHPARVVSQMSRMRRAMTPERIDSVLEAILREFAETGLRRELGIARVETTCRELRFSWRGRRYRVRLVGSDKLQKEPEAVPGVREILLTARAQTSVARDALVLDLETMTTPFGSDPIHTALRLFMLRFYGVRFKDSAVHHDR